MIHLQSSGRHIHTGAANLGSIVDIREADENKESKLITAQTSEQVKNRDRPTHHRDSLGQGEVQIDGKKREAPDGGPRVRPPGSLRRRRNSHPRQETADCGAHEHAEHQEHVAAEEGAEAGTVVGRRGDSRRRELQQHGQHRHRYLDDLGLQKSMACRVRWRDRANAGRNTRSMMNTQEGVLNLVLVRSRSSSYSTQQIAAFKVQIRNNKIKSWWHDREIAERDHKGETLRVANYPNKKKGQETPN